MSKLHVTRITFLSLTMLLSMMQCLLCYLPQSIFPLPDLLVFSPPPPIRVIFSRLQSTNNFSGRAAIVRRHIYNLKWSKHAYGIKMEESAHFIMHRRNP